MSLLERLRIDTVAARKAAIGKPVGDPAKARADLLVVLSGEVQMIGKNDGDRTTTDEEATALIRKFLKGVEENLGHRPEHPVLLREKAVLEEYLPQSLDETVLRSEIALFASTRDTPLTVRDTKAVFDALDAKFPGQTTSKTISAILKETA